MNTLFYFPPTLFCFLGGAIGLIITASLFPFITSLHPNRWCYFTNVFTLITLLITFLWALKIYPTHEVLLLSGHFLWNPLTALLSTGLIGLSLLVFSQLTETLPQTKTFYQDYHILGLLSLFGGLAMLTAGSWLSFYLGLEIMSLASYGLVGLNVSDPLRIEATIKYVLMGIICSILLLYGFCLIYAESLSLSLTIPPTITTHTMHAIGICFVLAGMLFKLGAMPFHFWVPDVYQGASLPSTLFIATITKFATIGMALRLLMTQLSHLPGYIPELLLSTSLLSIVAGNALTVLQTDIKRLLAYSSIAHMGFVLLGLSLPVLHYKMVIFYGLIYCFTMAVLLAILIHLAHVGRPIRIINDLKGLHAQYPTASLFITLVMSSMVGIPPFIGFFSKFGLIDSLLQEGFYATATLTSIANVLGAYYYLSMIKNMYFELPGSPSEPLAIHSVSIRHITLGLMVAGLLSLSLAPGLLIQAIESRSTVVALL